MSHEHYLPFFVGDFLASTATWTGPERGLYLQLLAFQWTSGPLPCDHGRLALALHYDLKEFQKLWPVMAKKFQNGDGALINPRLETVREKNAEIQIARSEAGRRGGQASGQARSNQTRKQTGSKIEASASGLLETNAKQNLSKNEPSDPIRSESDPNLPKPRGERAREARPVPRKRCPTEFQITDDLRAWAKLNAPDVDVDRETERMRDWEYRSGRSDWPAAWRTWMSRAQTDSANRPGRKPIRAPKTPEQIEAEAEHAKH